MKLKIEVDLSYALAEQCDLLLQIEVADCPHQHLDTTDFTVGSGKEYSRVSGEEGIGERVWLKAEGRFSCQYSAVVTLDRPFIELKNLKQSALNEIPADVVKYLMPSRYCIPENFFEFIANNFIGFSGGEMIVVLRDWINQNFTYDIDASNGKTDALESFNSGKGVCRDYAHVLIAMARAVAIPARFVSAYAPNVEPQDFHALVEVFLEGDWHLVDPTFMSKSDDTVIIGIGRDAADVSFLTTYGFATFENQSVRVARIN